MGHLAKWLAAAAALAAAAPAGAQEAAPWPSPDAAAVAAVESYLNGLPTVRARFEQSNRDGSTDRGVMWLWRPGLARIEYSSPTDVLLVADGMWLVYFDAELDQVSHIPIAAGPFRFLLNERVSLADDDVRVRALERGGGMLRLTMVDPQAPGDGEVTLVFDENPLALRQWEVVDAQGYLTVVRLTDAVLGERFEREWFYFPESARTRDFRVGEHD